MVSIIPHLLWTIKRSNNIYNIISSPTSIVDIIEDPRFNTHNGSSGSQSFRIIFDSEKNPKASDWPRQYCQCCHSGRTG